MNPREWFQLAVRILGLVFLYFALQALSVLITTLLFMHPIDPALKGLMPMTFTRFCALLFAVVWPALIAWWLIRGAPLLMKIAFRERP